MEADDGKRKGTRKWKSKKWNILRPRWRKESGKMKYFGAAMEEREWKNGIFWGRDGGETR